MERKNKLLTSVNVDRKNHKTFKVLCIENNITFQQLVNLAIEMYIYDEEFRKTINKN
mgnify:CR=1 FL=1|tara:strand:+ start:470 stop:640 length:171 start_codon:yes stop_codon:yes gene_type:complete